MTATQNRIMVPKQQAETPSGGGDQPFPAGNWIGTFEDATTKGIPPFLEGESFPTRGYVSEDTEIVTLYIGQNRPLDGQDDVGERKFFVDLVTRSGDVDWTNVDYNAGKGYPAWQVQRSARLAMNLAMALGLTETVTDEEGNEYETIGEDFLDTLRSGGLNGTEVGYEVRHRNWKTKEKSGVEEQIAGFFTAV